MRKMLLVFGALIGLTVLVQVYAEPSASAAVCTVTNNNLTNIFPRDRLGARENAGCVNADSFMWLSDYYTIPPSGGSPLQTPTARLRVFFLWSDVAARPDPIDTLSLFSPDGSRVRCGFSMNYTYVPTGQVIPISKTVASGCAWPTFLGFVPGANFNVNKSHLQSDVARYGSNVRFVDVNLDLTSADTNAPFRLWATGAGSTARISFREMSLAEAQSGAAGTTGSAFALWSNDMGGGATEPVTYTLNLAPDCSIAPGGLVNVYFKWYDADDDDAAGGTNAIHPFHMYIVDDTTGAHLTPPGGLSSASYVFGNDDEYAVYGPVALTGGHRYRWIWSEISRGNGVQVYMPFSEMNNDPSVVCTPPPPPNQPPDIDFDFNPCSPTGTVSFSRARVRDQEAGTLSISGGYSSVAVGANAWTNFTAPNFSGIRDGVPHTVTLTVTDAQGATDTHSANYTCTIPPPSVTCTFVTPAQTLEVGDNYYPVVRVSNANIAGAPTVNASVNISVNLAPAQARNTPSRGPIGLGGNATFGSGTSPTVTYPSTPATGVVITSAGSFSTTASASWTANGAPYSGTIPCTGSLGAGGNGNTGVLRPYFKVLGGDLISYGTNIRGYNQQGVTFDPVTTCSTAIRCGAGVETAIQNNGTIDGVPSRYKQATAGAGQKSLTYANTLGGVYASWGGGFGAGAPNITNSIPAGATAITDVDTIPANVNAEYRNTTGTLNGGNINPRTRATIYINGNVVIRDNITYVGSGNYVDRDAIPHFRVIAFGNIYIHPSVSQLDGEYIALGSGAAPGIVYTCHDGSWSVPISAVNINGPCSASTLIVNGGLVGDSVRLTRTTGTRRNAQATDGQTGGCAAPTALSRGYCNTANIAEIIQFTPELFVAKPASSPTNTPISGQYNSITSLPPLF